MEEQGFILRRPRAEDLRVRDVEITQPGREAFAKVWPTMYDALVKMFEGVDNAGIQGLHGDAAQDDPEHPQARHLSAPGLASQRGDRLQHAVQRRARLVRQRGALQPVQPHRAVLAPASAGTAAITRSNFDRPRACVSE